VRSDPPIALGSYASPSDEWLKSLTGKERGAAVARLHHLLVCAARREVYRRSTGLRVTGPELDDLAFQAAADAVVSVLSKLHQFRGDSRFTTWAYKFVMLEVSTKLARHFWRRSDLPSEPVDWGRLADRFGLQPDEQSEGRDLFDALVRAIDETLTERQRQVFVAIVVEQVPLDALLEQMGGTRGAIYKMLFDARRKLRAALVDGGHLAHDHKGT
jgi:RNA polymerase sigma-70 factor, ECF subfamily